MCHFHSLQFAGIDLKKRTDTWALPSPFRERIVLDWELDPKCQLPFTAGFAGATVVANSSSRSLMWALVGPSGSLVFRVAWTCNVVELRWQILCHIVSEVPRKVKGHGSKGSPLWLAKLGVYAKEEAGNLGPYHNKSFLAPRLLLARLQAVQSRKLS